MPKNDWTAHPTATTYHGIKISANMCLRFSPYEVNRFFIHIVKHQLTKQSVDFHLDELHQALGIANMGQMYNNVIYPRITDALKARLTFLENNEDFCPSVEGVIEGDRLRFYPKFMDAWTKPDWQGDLLKPREKSDQVQGPPSSPPRPSTPSRPSTVRSLVSVLHDTPAQGITPQSISSLDVPFQDTSAQDAPSHDIQPQEIPDQHPPLQSHLIQLPVTGPTTIQEAPVGPASVVPAVRQSSASAAHHHNSAQPAHTQPVSFTPAPVELASAQAAIVRTTSFHPYPARQTLSHLNPERFCAAQPQFQHIPSHYHPPFDRRLATPPISPSYHAPTPHTFPSSLNFPSIPASPQSSEWHRSPSIYSSSPSPWVRNPRLKQPVLAAANSVPDDHHSLLFQRRHGYLKELLRLRVQFLRLTGELARNTDPRNYPSLILELDQIRGEQNRLQDIFLDIIRDLEPHGTSHVTFLAFML